MPASIVRRADQVLAQLEESRDGSQCDAAPNTEASDAPKVKPRGRGKARISAPACETVSGMQLSFFQLDDPVLCQVRDEILGVDVNRLTPLEALTKLNDIKGILTGKHS